MSHMKPFEHLKISLEAIKSATNDFSNENCIGRGGFGEVYTGEIVHSMRKRVVALKRLNRIHGQGDPEFWKEILMLSSHKHENIISLLGYSDESGEKILVYEYASKKSLDLYLHSSELTWVRRLNICIGAALGLMYLHNAIKHQQRVLHRDIKSSNILLAENWNAKISDFGLSKLGPANQQLSFLVSTPVGTHGYCDPEYAATGFLTKESDVYSFGVVLFEVLSGRLCFDNCKDNDPRSFVRLARQSYKDNKLDDIIYSNIKDEISSDSLEMFATIAYQCTMRESKDRPLMTEVVKALEDALLTHLIMDPHAVICTEKNTLKVPALKIVNYECMEHPVGTLHVKVVRVTNLKKTCLFFERDCFVKVGLTNDSLPSKKTNTIESLNPEWNEEFPLVVKDLNAQALEISVWEGKGYPVRMWKHDLPLEDLIPEQQKSVTFELLKDMDNKHVENNKSHGQLMIELMYKPLTRDEVRSYSEEVNKVKKPLKVSGWLIVTILEGDDIQVTNPFIYVKIENDRRQTTLAKKSFDPVWNEEIMFSFEKPPTNEILNLELHSSSQMSKIFQWTKRGHVNISLEDIVKKTRTKEMYHLEDTTSGGRIHVELEWRASLQGRSRWGSWRVLGHPKLAQLAHLVDRIYVGLANFINVFAGIRELKSGLKIQR